MTIGSVGLLLGAALLHAIWNLLSKQTPERYLIAWWSLIISTLVFAPALLFTAPLPPAAWPYALASAACEAAYFGLLARAYTSGDFSLVYPIARGTAPALLALWAILFLGETLSVSGLIGIFVIVCGLMIAGGSAWWHARGVVRTQRSSIITAGGVAVCISLYSVIDGAAVQLAHPVTYIVITFGLTALGMAPIMGARYRPALMIGTLRRFWQPISLIGILTMIAYLLVLWAYALAPVSYGGAIREISIVFAAFLARWWLREAVGQARIGGALLIFAGIMLIAVAG